jgi:hypothetical protein
LAASYSAHKKKIAKGIGILCKARKIFKQSTLLTMYYSFIFPYIGYCIELWGSANYSLLSSIFKLQKRVVRIIVSAGYRAHTEPIFSQLSILPLSKVYQMNVILFMYKFSNDLLPNIFTAMFHWNKDVHQYNTRQARKLHVIKCKTSSLIKSLSYKGILMWNYITDKINPNCSIVTFKWHLKTYLLHSSITL